MPLLRRGNWDARRQDQYVPSPEFMSCLKGNKRALSSVLLSERSFEDLVG